MTINPKKSAWKTSKNAKKTDGKHGIFNKFFFVQIGVESTAGAKQQKMRMVPRVPNGKKTDCFLILPFCGAGPAQRQVPVYSA